MTERLDSQSPADKVELPDARAPRTTAFGTTALPFPRPILRPINDEEWDAFSKVLRGWGELCAEIEVELTEAKREAKAAFQQLYKEHDGTPRSAGTRIAEPCQKHGCRFDVAQSLLDRAKERGELSESEVAVVASAEVPAAWLEMQGELVIGVTVERDFESPFTWLPLYRTPQSASERIVWPKEKLVGRMGEMAPKGEMTLMLCLQDDGDVIVEVAEVRHREYYRAQAEFCTLAGGGGRSPRTREALIALMVAIEADNAESPYRAWPLKKENATDATTDRKANP